MKILGRRDMLLGRFWNPSEGPKRIQTRYQNAHLYNTFSDMICVQSVLDCDVVGTVLDPTLDEQINLDSNGYLFCF